MFDTSSSPLLGAQHCVPALTSLVNLNLLLPSWTTTNLRILQVLVSLLIGPCLLARRRPCPAALLTGPARPMALALSSAIIGALWNGIVYNVRSQVTANGPFTLTIGPATGQPAYSSSPRPGAARLGSRSQDIVEGRCDSSLVPECVRPRQDPATSKHFPARPRPGPSSKPNHRQHGGQSCHSHAVISSVNCQIPICLVIKYHPNCRHHQDARDQSQAFEHRQET